MKSAIVLGLAAGVSGFLRDPVEHADNATCGNCYHVPASGNFTNYTRCNTGVDMDKIPFSFEQDLDTIQVEVDKHGISTAEVKTISEVKAMFDGATESFDQLFCADYLNMFRDGTKSNNTEIVVAGAGATCVRGDSIEWVKAADADARKLFEKFGTHNGYPSGYAIDRNRSYTEVSNAVGTDFTLNLPANWCSPMMRSMFCGVVFPQVVANKTAVEVARVANNAEFGTPKWNGRGALRPILIDDCESLFQTCSRREPIEDVETESDYKDPALFNKEGKAWARAAAFEAEGEEGWEEEDLEHAVDVEHFCRMWANGFDVASAGTAMIDNSSEWASIQFEAAPSNAASLLLAAVLAAVALML